MRTKLTAIQVSSCHLIPVIYGQGGPGTVPCARAVTARPAYPRPNAYTLLLLSGGVVPLRHAVPQYPEPQYTLPSTIAAPPVTEPQQE